MKDKTVERDEKHPQGKREAYSVTAGFKCAPDTPPENIIPNRTASPYGWSGRHDDQND